MNGLTIACKNEQRRELVRQHRLNGLDYLEVGDNQKTLSVYFLGNVPDNIAKENIWIEGGQRIRNLKVTGVEVKRPKDPTLDGYLRVEVDRSGDFSTYTLRLVEAVEPEEIEFDESGQPIPPEPLAGFDRRYAQLKFNFKVGCPSDLDCKTAPICPSEARIEPEINYLAKDYASFRQLILDRLALIMPEWRERHVPDIGITLVELLAYVGDYLSYYQDAVATEAYLDTARQRISVRRHARLVDYWMHEGCNARTWVWIETDTDTDKPISPSEIFFITSYPGAPERGTVLLQKDLDRIPYIQYEVFEPIATEKIKLYAAHSEIYFYTWGDRQCCLPKGSTTATLKDEWNLADSDRAKQSASEYEKPDPCDEPDRPQSGLPDRKLHLKPGDILIFEEVKGAKTGNEADADPTRRHAVRLTKVVPREDPVIPYELKDKESDESDRDLPTPVLEIEWAVEDALPFPLCISAIGPAPECCLITDVSVARGNVILVDNGRKIDRLEDLGTVNGKETISWCEAEGQPSDVTTVPLLFRPKLSQAPLTFSQPLSAKDLTETPASKLLEQDPRQALPQITELIGYPSGTSSADPEREEWKWIPQPDLSNSYSRDRHFVVEMDDEGYACLRFGDGELGQQTEVGTHFLAKYRIGNGLAGNIGAETIAHLVFRQTRWSGGELKPHNPFPAKGGTSPEPLSEVKLFAPTTFRKELKRAIAAQDYADIVMRDFPVQVQRAAANLRWTGSWYEVLVAIDPRHTEVAGDKLLQEIEQHLYLYRRMGHDVMVKSATYVSLAIALQICVLPDYLRGHVKAALLEAFSNRHLVNGQLGFFHPDNLTFGTGIYLSQLVAVAQAVPGVMSVRVTRLKRLADVADPLVPAAAESFSEEILNGILPLGPWEIARLDNDPSFPENGVLKLEIGGGR